MVKPQKSSSDVMAAGTTVGPKQVRMNQLNKSHDLMMQIKYGCTQESPNQIGQYLMRSIGYTFLQCFSMCWASLLSDGFGAWNKTVHRRGTPPTCTWYFIRSIIYRK